MQVPTDARFEMMLLRDGKSEKQYLKDAWDKRYPQRPVKSRKGWPFVRLADQVAVESRINVLALPKSIQRKAGERK